MVDVLKTVICALNSKYVHSSLAPWYLAAAVDRHCAGKASRGGEGTINEQVEDGGGALEHKVDVVLLYLEYCRHFELVRLIKPGCAGGDAVRAGSKF